MTIIKEINLMELKICVGLHIHTHTRTRADVRESAFAHATTWWCYIEDVISSFPFFIFIGNVTARLESVVNVRPLSNP